MHNAELPPYDAFYSKLRSYNPLETEYTGYVNLLKKGLTTEQAVIKLKLSKAPLLELRIIITCNRYGGKNKWAHSRTFCGGIATKMLCQLWRQCKRWLPFTTTKISICWSLVVHYQTWLTFAYKTLPMQNFIPSQKAIKTYWKKIREDVVRGPSIVFARKAVVDETFNRKSANICKSIVGIDANQLHPYSMCQPKPTGLYTCWDLDSEASRFTPRQNKTRSFENMVISYFQQARPKCEIESFFTTGWRKKIDCFGVDGFCFHCNTVFEAMGCFCHFCPCQELRSSLTEEDFQRGSKKRELDGLRRHYKLERG